MLGGRDDRLTLHPGRLIALVDATMESITRKLGPELLRDLAVAADRRLGLARPVGVGRELPDGGAPGRDSGNCGRRWRPFRALRQGEVLRHSPPSRRRAATPGLAVGGSGALGAGGAPCR
jgi:hypothetical protein